MHFQLTEEQLMIQAVAHDFDVKQIVPVAAQHDDSGEFPAETVRQMGELGLLGVEVPVEYGGMGLSKEMPVERCFREARITETYAGTSEIKRLVTGRLETGLR
ncbi:MAG TPA: acyl-CoA dehydrogenase family protein [Xanthomonadales bacterium]|nr:acyl-CoA dehydrogenase family protein [Xanthomonadales bacterium]